MAGVLLKFTKDGRFNDWLSGQGYSLVEEEQIYDSQLDDLLRNARWYLEHFDKMKSYRVSWKCYQTRKPTPTLPYKYVKHRQKEKDL